MTADWSPLDRELAHWQAAGLTLPLWWRDDDAVAPGASLDRLAVLAQTHDLPVHLAVVPQKATQALAEQIKSTCELIPVVHGWAHYNHAPQGTKKAEFGAHRALAVLTQEAAQGLNRMKDLFGSCLRPVFVPPWNRIAPQLADQLGGLGYRALSTFTPRAAPFAAPGLARINTHIDPIAWRAGGGLVDPDTLIKHLVDQLQDRRTGRADNDEPYGILTHHLVHDEAVWAFTDALLTRLTGGPIRVWTADDLTQEDMKT